MISRPQARTRTSARNRVTPLVAGAVVVSLLLSSCLPEEERELPAPKDVSEVGPIDASVAPEAMLHDGVLLVSTLVDENRVEAFDAVSGESLWQAEELYSNGVWVGDDFVVLTTLDERVEVLDLATGEVRHEITLEPENMAGSGSALLQVTATTIFLSHPHGDHGEALSAVDVETGGQLWDRAFGEDGKITAFPALLPASNSADPGSELMSVAETTFGVFGLSSRAEAITAVDAETGDELWHQDHDTYTPADIFVLDAELAAKVDSESDDSCRRTFGVTQTESGEVHDFTVHQFEYDDEWQCEDSAAITIDDNLLLAQDADKHPQVTDMKTGDVVWTADQTGQPLGMIDGTVSYRTSDGDVVVADAKSGKKRWDSDAMADGRGVMTKDLLLLSDDAGVVATRLIDGDSRWLKKDASVLTHDDKYIVFFQEASDGFMLTVTEHDPTHEPK